MELFQEENVDPQIYSYAMAIVITAIISVSIVFELTEETALERSEEWIKPIVQTLFGELTILGFIGLVMFSVTKVGKDALDNIACNPNHGFFAHQEESCLDVSGFTNQSQVHVPQEILDRGWICLENPLIEITENAHMTLFFVMMLFLIIVVTNLSIGRHQLRFWRQCEDYCVINSIDQLRTLEEIALKNTKKTCWHWCPFMCRSVPTRTINSWCCNHFCCNAMVLKKHTVAWERLRYAGTRIAFIKSNNERAKDDDHRLDPHFDMKEYLSQQMTEKLTETIEIKITNWLAIYFIFMLFVCATYVLRLNSVDEKKLNILLAGCSIVGMWLSFALICYVNATVQQISSTLIHPGHLEHSHSCYKKWNAEFHIDHYINSKLSNQNKHSDTRESKTSMHDQHNLQTPLLKSTFEQRLSPPSTPDTIKNNPVAPNRLTPRRRNSLQASPTSKRSKRSPKQASNDNAVVDVTPDSLYRRTLTEKRNELCTSVGLTNTLVGTERHEHFPLFKHHYNGSIRAFPKKDCCGRQPDLHEHLFWGMKHGNQAVYNYLTSAQLMMALYLGTLVVNFSSPILTFVDSWEMTVLVSIVAILPVIGHILVFSILLPRLVFITSIHGMASSKLTAKTTHIMRSRKALRMLMYACAIKDAHKVAMKVRTKGLRGATFSKLSNKEQKELEKECRVKTIAQGQDILVYGHTNDYLYVIVSGSADVIVNGKKVATLHAPQEFGLLSLLNNVTCTATVRSGPDCPLICYLLDIDIYNKYFKAKSKMSLAVAKSEASMNVAIKLHEGDDQDEKEEGDSPTRPAKQVHPRTTVTQEQDEIHQEEKKQEPSTPTPHHKSISIKTAVRTRTLAHNLAKKKHQTKKSPTKEISFAQRVRKGGRPKKAIEAYRRGALVDLFVMMDNDMGGTVDEDELTQFLIKLFAPKSSKLGETEIRQIELMIAGLDEDGDGEVSVMEFLNVMEPIVRQMEEEETPAEITARMWEVLDEDSGGSVTISEFRDVLAKVGLTMSYEEVRELFAEFDHDGSGALEEEELLAFMKSQI